MNQLDEDVRVFVDLYQKEIVTFFLLFNSLVILLTFILIKHVQSYLLPLMLLGLLSLMLIINGIAYWIIYSGKLLRYVEDD